MVHVCLPSTSADTRGKKAPSYDALGVQFRAHEQNIGCASPSKLLGRGHGRRLLPRTQPRRVHRRLRRLDLGLRRHDEAALVVRVPNPFGGDLNKHGERNCNQNILRYMKKYTKHS